MTKPTSSVGPFVPIMSAPALATPSMFTTSPESYFHGGPLVPSGYKTLSGIFSGASSNPWNLPMSSSGIITGKPIVSTEWLDSLYTSSRKYQFGPSVSIPSSINWTPCIWRAIFSILLSSSCRGETFGHPL